MFKHFGDYFLAFLLSAAIGGFAVIMIVATLGHGYIWSLVALVVWFILCGVFFGKMAKKRIKRLNGLYNDCKLDEYVEEYDKLEAKSYMGEGKRAMHMNRARGLIPLGAIDEAIEDLNDIVAPEKHKLKDMNIQAVLNSLLFAAYIEKGDLEKATKALAVCKFMINDKLFRDPYLSTMIEICKRSDARLQLARGEFDGLEKEYLDFLDRSFAEIDKVICHYRLAEIAEHFGQEEKREEHLKYVAEKGGTSIYRYYAEKALNGEPVEDKAIYIYEG